MPTARPDGVSTKRTAPRARGRPPRATREQIVDAAVALLRDGTRRAADHGPGRQRGGAHAHGAVPPLQGPRRAHGRGRRPHPHGAQRRHPREGPWQDQLRAWVLGGLEYLVPVRAESCRSCSPVGRRDWVHDAATLVRILEQAGFEDDELAEMQVWIALSVGGYVMAEASRRKGPNMSEMYAAARAPRRPTTPNGWRC